MAKHVTAGRWRAQIRCDELKRGVTLGGAR
jgi:hypothetical protein